MKEVMILTPKATDLQKVIADVKASLQDKELQDLADHVLDKIRQNNNNLSEILKDSSLQATLQSVLQNKNIAGLLNNPNLSSQVANFLNTPGNAAVIEQLKNAFRSSDSEKKKINSDDTSTNELHRLKEELLAKYNAHHYDKQRKWLETIKPLLPPVKQKTLESMYNLLLVKEILESTKNVHENPLSETKIP